MPLEPHSQVTTFLQIGEPVVTPEGPGVVTGIALNLAEYGGEIQLEPPAITVKLDSGKTIVTCLCTLDFGDCEINEVIKSEFERLWPPMLTVPEAHDVVKKTAISLKYDTSVLTRDTIEEFAPELALRIAALGFDDALVVNGVAYVPLPASYPRSHDTMRFGEVAQFLTEIEMKHVPDHYHDDIVSWLSRLGATAQSVLILRS